MCALNVSSPPLVTSVHALHLGGCRSADDRLREGSTCHDSILHVVFHVCDYLLHSECFHPLGTKIHSTDCSALIACKHTRASELMRLLGCVVASCGVVAGVSSQLPSANAVLGSESYNADVERSDYLTAGSKGK